MEAAFQASARVSEKENAKMTHVVPETYIM